MNDALAFLRTILKNPGDAVAPLVFADWLDESGEPANLTWASFIRAHDALERTDPSDPRHADLRKRADFCAARVRYRVRLHASNFLPHAETLVRLLPAP